MDRLAVSGGGEREDEDIGPLGRLGEALADPHLGVGIGIGQAVGSTAEQAHGVALLGKALRQVGHTQVSPDDGEAVGVCLVGMFQGAVTPFGGSRDGEDRGGGRVLSHYRICGK